MVECYLGIDLGATNVKLGLFAENLDLIDKISVPTQADEGPETVVSNIGKAARQLADKSGHAWESIRAAGMGTAGPQDLRRGVILGCPNMPKLRNCPIRDMVAEQLGKKTIMENDANAACWGEFAVGAGRGVKELVFFTLGSGIGGGVVTNGHLVHGYTDEAAELGHVIIYPEGRLCGCGQKGCAEAYASANSTAARATEAVQEGRSSSLAKVLKEKGRITSRDVYQHSAEGDALALDITEGTAKTLGLLCVNTLHVTQPQRIVFGGGMTAAGEPLLNRIRHYFQHYIWTMKPETIEICFATLGEDAGIIGAAALAHEQFRP